MSISNCLSYCVHWAGGKCRLESIRGGAFGVQDCPHFDQRVAARAKSGIKAEL